MNTDMSVQRQFTIKSVSRNMIRDRILKIGIINKSRKFATPNNTDLRKWPSKDLCSWTEKSCIRHHSHQRRNKF